jgi:hypothetical protein
MEVKYHLVDKHHVLAGAEPITCVHPKCAKEMKVESMWQHWITHLGVRIECTVCYSTFAARLDAFKRHAVGGCSGHGRYIASRTLEEDAEVAPKRVEMEGPRPKKPRIE